MRLRRAVGFALLGGAAAGAIGLAVAYHQLTTAIDADVSSLVAESTPSATIVSDSVLATLPAPAQRYLRYAGVVGRPIPRLVRVTQTGRLRSGNDAGWMPLAADETYSLNPPAFVWRAAMPNATFPVVLGRDEYLDGSGSILMKALALAPVADEHGDELGAAGLMRYLNETMWFPAALLGPNITLTPIDENSFGLRIVDRGVTAEGVLFVDAEGKPTTFRAQRYNTNTRQLETWETPIASYGEFAGYRLPSAGSAVWKLASGDLDYIELSITSVAYEP